MKQVVLRMFRTVVSLVVVGTIAMMIFSLRGELAQARAQVRAAADVGYPAENPPPKDKWNAAKVHYDVW